MYSIKDLVKWWHRATDVTLDTSAIDNVSPMMPYVTQQFRKLKDEYVRHVNLAESEEIEEEIEEERLKFIARQAWFLVRSFETFGRNVGCSAVVSTVLGPAIEEERYDYAIRWIESSLPALTDLLQLQRNLAELGLILRPSRSGPQDGEYGNQLRFYQAVTAIAQKEYDDRADQWAEDDES